MVASVIDLSSLDGENGFRLDGVTAGDLLGNSVSNAGDVNGDGFDDLIVAAPFADQNARTNSGSSYVVFGKASGFSAAMNLSSLDGSHGFRLDGAAAADKSGRSISNAGDVNGDGFDDVIIGTYSDSSYVVFGKASGFSATMDLSSLDGNNGFRLDGTTELDQITGISVSGAGDINGDGFDDVIIGSSAFRYSNTPPLTVDYVVFGKASGFDSTLNLSSLDGNNGFRVDMANEFALQSRSVSSAGDVNGDGYDDLIIGILFPSTYRGDHNGIAEYVIFGKASGFDSAFELSSLDGSNGFKLIGAELNQFDSSGPAVSSAGDINGDGFDDLIVGARTDSKDFYQGGDSYVVFGKASGFGATLSLASLDGSNGFRVRGGTYFEYVGQSVSGAGDVNGDGFDDLIVGVPGDHNASGAHSGASYVVYGKASGFAAILDLPNIDGNNGFRLDGVAALDLSGASVSGAGDINGDGLADLIVGAPHADLNGTDSGSSYVVFGHRDVSEKVILGTPGNDELTGTSAAERFKAGAGDDRMIGRGGADQFYGGAGNDYIRIGDLGFVQVDGGAGKDTLGLGEHDMNLDLTLMGDKIRDIEIIYLFGNGDNTLTLTAGDVLDLSDTTNTLRVNGNAGDRIVGLSNGWEDGGVHNNFHTYTDGDAVLLVGVNVATDFA